MKLFGIDTEFLKVLVLDMNLLYTNHDSVTNGNNISYILLTESNIDHIFLIPSSFIKVVFVDSSIC